MASSDNWKKGEDKQPVLSSQFRMAVEKQISKFIDSGAESLDFPCFLSVEQRNFVNEYAYKLGLKAKSTGKGLNVKIALFRNQEGMMKAANTVIKLRDRSKIVLTKLFEILNKHEPPEKEVETFDELFPHTSSAKKQLSLSMTRIGSVARGNTTIMSIPPKHFNPACVELRQNLPIFKVRKQLIELIRTNQVVIVESSTGSGKSTQIPNYILEEFAEMQRPCRVIVAEPKRICATSLADRVSFERGEPVGTVVGYQIRLESKVAPTSNLIFVTNGVILRMLMSGKPEEFFRDITALVIDEVHERDKFSDFLMLCVRENLHINRKLKVIIMSATVEAKIFSEYFGGCPVFKVEGSAHPVDESFLEDTLKLLKFSSPPTEMMKKIPPKPKIINISDETKANANILLSKIAESSCNDCEFQQFLTMVETNYVSVDIRHEKSGKSALMMAVEHNSEEQVKKLMGVKADAGQVLGGVNVFDMAIDKEKILTILKTATDLMNEGAIRNEVIENGTCQQDRDLIDAYYDTLVTPGSRGCFLEDIVDLNLIVHLVRHLHFNTDAADGILVFLPGHDEIIQLANLLYNSLDTNYEIFILHSQMQTKDQVSVFDDLPSGIRKIILSTNIAESSLTIDVTYVIDSGKEKKKTYNAATHVSCLQVQWISKASSKQRKGRAGRLHGGVVYRMYSRDRYNSFDDNAKPEFTRCDLTDICLQAKMIANGGTVGEFLSKAITPPSEINVLHMVNYLIQIGALEQDEAVTQLGLYLADIPLNVKYAKMLIYGIAFKCIDPILTIVSILSISDPFKLSFKVEERNLCHKLKISLEDQSFSDHFVMLRIFQKWNEYKSENVYDGNFCEDNYVSAGTLDRITSTRLKIVGYLRSVRLIHSVGNIAALNEFSHSWSMIKAVIAAGSYPEVARIYKRPGEISTAVDPKILINPGSILNPAYNKKLNMETISSFPVDWMIYEEKNLAGNVAMAKHCTLVSSVSIALTAGHKITIKEDIWSADHSDETLDIAVDKFIVFQADKDVAYALKKLRDKLNGLVRRFIGNVAKFRFQETDDLLLEGLKQLLELEDDVAGFKTKYHGIGARPRVITRHNDDLKEIPRQEMEVTVVETPTVLKTLDMQPQPQQQLPGFTKMRFFMVQLHDEKIVKTLKTKLVASVEDDAKLPDDFIDFLVEAENIDRISRKTLVFHSEKEIVGVAYITDISHAQVQRKNLKIYFQCQKRVDLQEVRSRINNDFEYLQMVKKKFAEIPPAIGQFCVDKCLNIPSKN